MRALPIDLLCEPREPGIATCPECGAILEEPCAPDCPMTMEVIS
jgi:hypothetical protein